MVEQQKKENTCISCSAKFWTTKPQMECMSCAYARLISWLRWIQKYALDGLKEQYK